MREQEKPFFHLAMDLAKQHDQQFRERPLTGEELADFQQKTEQSIQQQHDIEAADTISFDDYLADYYQQYQQLK